MKNSTNITFVEFFVYRKYLKLTSPFCFMEMKSGDS